MKARVPYLARLARQAAERATLVPPRQLFVGDTYTPVRSPGRDDSSQRRAGGAAAGRFPRALPPSDAGQEPPAQPGIAFPRGEDVHGDSAGGAPGASAELAPGTGVPALPVASAVQATAAGVPATPGGPHAPRPPDVAPQSPAARAESPRAAGIASATPANAGPVLQPGTPLPSSSSRPAGDTARAQPLASWTSPLWGTPVDLPQAIELLPVAGETDRQAPSRPRAAAPPPGPGPATTARQRQDPPRTDAAIPATPPPGPGPATTARPRQDPPRTDAAIPATPDDRDAAGRERSGGTTAVRDLIPPPASAPRSIAMLGPEPGELHQKPRVSGRPRVSIGTIEVTVLPPAPPPPLTHEIRPPAQVARGWTRPPSLLAASAGADRLRDGLRRWYGTAQG